MRRVLGFVLIRGEEVVSLTVEGPPQSRAKKAPSRAGWTGDGGGRGAGHAAGDESAPAMRGLGGPAPAAMMPGGGPPPGMRPPGDRRGGVPNAQAAMRGRINGTFFSKI